ncbi:MAG: hypothetical protein AB7K24_02050 [Gemmataceae bacterium]
MRSTLTRGFLVVVAVLVGLLPWCWPSQAKESADDAVRPELILRDRYDIQPIHVAKDKDLKIDYDIVYVRAPLGKFVWPDVGAPTLMEPGADLMLLHPDGKEEVLVKGGDKGSVADPYVSFDGQWVFYAFFYATEGSDIYKIHVPTRKIVRLTHTGGRQPPHTEKAYYHRDDDSQVLLLELTGKTGRERDKIHNTGPCPVPGGKIVFTSNRHGFVPRKGSFTSHAMQLTVMNDDGTNVETIGHLNLGCALHPVILTDGRLMFSTLENQGVRGTLHWSIWTIHPDGTNWNPLVSDLAKSLAPSFHFQTQRSDGRAVVEMYYNVNQAGFGTLLQFPITAPAGTPSFGPGYPLDERNRPLRMLSRGGIKEYRLPFSPHGIDVLTPFANDDDAPAACSVRADKTTPTVGRLTHPCGAPDNHVLAVWSPNHDCSRDGKTGGVRRVGNDTGIYLIKAGAPAYDPGEMRLIKNDPNYHEQWPRPLVPYKRTYGIDEPRRLETSKTKSLPAGTPFGLVGTSSLYKRESANLGQVPEGGVTAVSRAVRNGPGAWQDQGSDAGVYSNSDIHAIRIVLQEPNTREDQRRFYNHAHERLRILGEIPVRKFNGAGQPKDPDGNPDTSFLAKIPADTSFTFQTLDKHGMVLNMAQTWHQVRPGEFRADCGGCHAHSQQPTLFEKTAAAQPDYKVFDLVEQTPLLTAKKNDQSGKQWDDDDATGLRFAKGVVDVEYWHDIRPILQRSCAACHTSKADKPAGGLVLDDDRLVATKSHLLPPQAPASYLALAATGDGYGRRGSRYVRELQARSSLLTWKIFGKRMDGRDQPEVIKGPKNTTITLDYAGSIMPPVEAVKGTYKRADGTLIKVEPLSDEDRRTLVRWIDLGCPIDLTYDPAKSDSRTGFYADRTLPTLTVAEPAAGKHGQPIRRLLIGMHDGYSGLDAASFKVTASFMVNGMPAGLNLAKSFRSVAPGVWELELKAPISQLKEGTLIVSVKDKQGNETRIDRVFSVDVQ